VPEKSSRVVLSARQLAIVRQLSTGATDRDIAVALGLSPRTVSNTLSTITSILSDHHRKARALATH